MINPNVFVLTDVKPHFDDWVNQALVVERLACMAVDFASTYPSRRAHSQLADHGP